MKNFETKKAELQKNGVDVDENKNIVLLTKKNAEIIEGLIKNDDRCFSFAECIFKYLESKGKTVDKDRQALWAVIRGIDIDNSTNAWRFNKYDSNKIVEYIVNPENKFFDKLKDGNVELPDELITDGKKKLKSLSSKICKFLSDYMYLEADSYYINDEIIRKKLVVYLRYYHVDVDTERLTSNKVNNLSYEKLFVWLEKLHKARNERYGDKITKNELDHIIWYSYK